MSATEQRLRDLGRRLRDFREGRGWTQKTLAGHLRCSQAMVCFVEQGDRPPHMKMAVAIEALTSSEVEPLRMNEWIPAPPIALDGDDEAA